jgi:hypothetical protein
MYSDYVVRPIPNALEIGLVKKIRKEKKKKISGFGVTNLAFVISRRRIYYCSQSAAFP